MSRLFHHLQKLPLAYKLLIGYCIFCFIYASTLLCYKNMRNRTAISDRSVELQPVAPVALNSHTLFYGSFELPPAPPTVEAVVYRGDKTWEVDYEDCVICLGSFEEGDECWVLKDCNHVYHKNCIEKWLRRCWNCPLCHDAIVRAWILPANRGSCVFG